MNKLLLLPTLLVATLTASAQTINCTTLQTENAALKEKIVAYEARLGIGVGGSTVEDGDANLKIRFISCKASKSTHKATFTFLITNSAEPTRVIVSGAASSSFGSNATMIVDEAGQGYRSEDALVYVGGKAEGNTVPTNVAVSCTIPLFGLPTTVTRLQAATIMLYKFSPANEKTIINSTIKNMPVTWVP